VARDLGRFGEHERLFGVCGRDEGAIFGEDALNVVHYVCLTVSATPNTFTLLV
jgi:hypothetical protein